MTAPVWIRGILSDDYGVAVNSVTYYTGGLETTGRSEKLKLDLPADIHVQPIKPDQTLAAMLATGEIDALHTARMPSTYRNGAGKVKRLFDDFERVEREYFRRTGIFPIMHTVVIRRELFEREPWVAQSLYKAFCAAQRSTYDDLAETAASKAMLPWLMAHVEETRREMGNDFWPYGFKRNRDTLATFLRYSYEQGLSKELLAPERLFAPQTLESFTI
jgi:4,5-dihydroxyphthalate decarboxylase